MIEGNLVDEMIVIKHFLARTTYILVLFEVSLSRVGMKVAQKESKSEPSRGAIIDKQSTAADITLDLSLFKALRNPSE